MKPVYFPFTYISPADLSAFAQFFDSVTMYRAIDIEPDDYIADHPLVDMLDVCIPFGGDANDILNRIDEYKHWANVHQAADKTFLSAGKDSVWLRDNNATSSIRQALLGRQSQLPESEKENLITTARIFLTIAEDFDRKTHEANNNLENFDRLEQNFIKDLKGNNDEALFPAGSKIKFFQDLGAHMSQQRLWAWSLLAQISNSQKSDINSGIFITTSPYLFDSAKDMGPESVALGDIKVWLDPDLSLSPWKEMLIKTLSNVITSPWSDTQKVELPKPPSSQGKGFTELRMRFEVLPEVPPGSLLQQMAGKRSLKDVIIAPQHELKNSIIGLLTTEESNVMG